MDVIMDNLQPATPKIERKSVVALTLLGIVILILTPFALIYAATSGTGSAPAVTVSERPTTARGLINRMTENGFVLTDEVDTIDAVSEGLFRESIDVRINGVEGGVLTFIDDQAVQDWKALIIAFDGIAVIGDRWAVDLDSDGSGGTSRQQSIDLANRIVAEVGGTLWMNEEKS